MFQRLRWLAIGAAGGVGASVWARRKARLVASRYAPGGLAAGAADRVRGWPGEVREALREGRSTMRQTEDELRGRYPGGATVTDLGDAARARRAAAGGGAATDRGGGSPLTGQ